MHIAYDNQIFRLQQNGGISKYFVKVIENLVLEKDVYLTVVSGIHKNEYLINSNIKYSGIFYFNFIRKLISNRFYDFTSAYNFFIEKNILSKKKLDIIHQTYNGYELYKPTNTKCIITIHDLIYEKYPNDFSDLNEVLIRKKASIENAIRNPAIATTMEAPSATCLASKSLPLGSKNNAALPTSGSKPKIVKEFIALPPKLR